jgi:SpoVK/Ycf46/Vps4 family AAA+-type ATPase
MYKGNSSVYIPPFTNKGIFDARLPPMPPPIKKELKIIDMEINGLQDILKLISEYPLSPMIEYNINMISIHNIKEPLNELNDMIGMNALKDSVVDQIVYFIQDLHINKNAANQDFMHTCIYGPPGTGKTEIAKIMGKIFSGLGVLKNKSFKKVTRADLIAGYLGQTAIKTREVINESLGGVLFIDEAYALGNPEKRDSFAKECIDTLCEALSDNKDQLMVIIAGYEEDLKKCFFSYNQGLNSRFPWRFKTDDYKGPELNKIFKKKVLDAGWSFKDDIKDEWFENKMESFPFYGRDMETLLAKAKIAHGSRVFCKPKEEKTKLTARDIEKGYEMFLKNNGKKEKTNPIEHMYL